MNQLNPSLAVPMSPQGTAEVLPSPAYCWCVVAFLTLASTVSIIDRQILALMVGPIQADLGVSDTMMGLLGGLAFTLFYTAMTMPIAWLADSGRRTWIIGWGILFWSLATVACGLAGRYWHLFLARMGVGLGEASLHPAAISLLSDYFDRARLPLALGVFNAAPFVGIGIANILGGLLISHLAGQPVLALPLLGEVRSWQAMFVLVGAPGVVLGLGAFVIREPKRRGRAATGVHIISVAQAAQFFLGRKRVLGLVFGAFIALSMQAWALFYWIAELFVRDHGMPRGEFGILFGTIALVGGTLGSIAAGYVSGALTRAGVVDAPLRVIFWVVLGLIPLGIYAPVASDLYTALTVFAVALFFMGWPAGLITTATQMIVPNEYRGKVVALYFIVVNFISYSCGPLLGGFISDFVFGGASIGGALSSIAAINYPVAAILLALSLSPFRSAMQMASAWADKPVETVR